jgi:hypothetical protein
MSEPLLRIGNHHAPGCGDPPIINGDDPDLYIGYFENAHGEQWLFTYHRKNKQAEIRGGDAGWNQCFAVRHGKVDGLILSSEESDWPQSCWHAATAFSQ